MRFVDLYERINIEEPRRLNVVNPRSDSVLDAVRQAAEKGYVIPVLFGDEKMISEKLEKNPLPGAEIIHAQDEAAAAELAVKDVRAGHGHLLMKGDIPTASFMKPVLNRDYGLRTGSVLSHIAVADTDFVGRLIFIADGGITIRPDLDVKRAIAANTAVFAEQLLGKKPVMAFAAAIEVINEKMPETGEARILAEEYANRGYIAEGPVAFDVIFSQTAAAKKGIESRISERTDVIIMPDMTTANFMVKQLIFFSKAAVGGIIAGASVPLILLSRSDSAETKLNSIILGLL